MVLESLESETPNIKDLSVEDLGNQETENILTTFFDLKKIKQFCDECGKSGEYRRSIRVLADFKIFSGAKFHDILPLLDYEQIFFTIFNRMNIANMEGKPFDETTEYLVEMKLLFPELFDSTCRRKNGFAEIMTLSHKELKNQLLGLDYSEDAWLTNAYQFSILFHDELKSIVEEKDFSYFQSLLFKQIKEAIDEKSGTDALKEDVCIFAMEARIVYGRNTVSQIDYQILLDWFKEKAQRQMGNTDYFRDLSKTAASLAIIAAENVTVDNEGIKISGNRFLPPDFEDESTHPLPEQRSF